MNDRRPPSLTPSHDAAAELDRMCRNLAAARTPYDELGQVRAEARLMAALTDARSRGRAAPVGARRRMGVVIGVTAAAAVAAATVIVAYRGGRIGARPVQDARLEPYLVAPTNDAAFARAIVPATLTQPAARWEVPAGWLVRARLGEHAKVTILGPARLSVETGGGEGAAPITQVTLSQGRLLAELAGGAGQRLRIVTADAVTTVVGTLFAVEAIGGTSRVSVSHGRVRVATPAGAREVASGESWLTTAAATEVVAPATEEALAEHHRIAAPVGPSVPLVVAGAPGAADVWIGERRIAAAPAWLRVEARTEVRLSAPGYPDAVWPLPGRDGGDVAAPPSLRITPPPTRTEGPAGAPAGAASASPGARVAADPPAPGRLRRDERAVHRGRALSAEPPAPADDSSHRESGPPLPTTAADLYRQADEAQAIRDPARAQAALRELVERHPRDPLAGAAHYELALMAHAAGDESAVLDHLDLVSDPTLAEPVHYLRCRALIAHRSDRADACLVAFRRQFPRSAHDAEALAALAALRGR